MITEQATHRPFQNEGHPRLYFSQDDLPMLREGARSGARATILRSLCLWCDRFLDPNDEHYFDFRERRRPIWKKRDVCHTWQLGAHMLPFAYAFTGDERYGKAAREVLLNAIETQLADNPFDGTGSNRDYKGWRNGTTHQHDKSNYAWAVCHIYDLCHDLFSEVERALIRKHILEGIEVLSERDVYLAAMIDLTNNRGARSIVGVHGIYPLAIEGEVEFPRLEDCLSEAVLAAETFIQSAFDRDGVSFEGPGYGGALSMIYAFAKMLARSGRADLLRNPFWERFAQHQLFELLPGGGTLNNLNDCDTPCGSIQPSAFLMGSDTGAILPWLARQLDLHPLRANDHANSLGGLHASLKFPALLWEWRDNVPLRTPQELGFPLSRCFPQRGIASMRTGWGADDFLISHKCGEERYKQHGQSDQNHIALYALGEHFLVDEGYGHDNGFIPATPEEACHYRRADVHNTVIFDGQDQKRNLSSDGWVRQGDGRIIDWQHTPDFDTSLGDAARAYGYNGAINKALRRVVFVREATHPFLIIVDTMELGDEQDHSYEVLWRTAKNNSIETEENRFIIFGNKVLCHGEVLFPATAKLVTQTHFKLPQLRVNVHANALEIVTIFTPLRKEEKVPQYTCVRHEGGDFSIVARDGAHEYSVRAGTQLVGPLREPIAVEFLKTNIGSEKQ